MNGIDHFLVCLVVAIAVFYVILKFSVRKRLPRPYLTLALLAVFVTAGGMIFARVTYGKELSWWIFYGIPVLTTFFLPPVFLRMNKKEFFSFAPLTILSSPVIHIFFSFFLGWHEYMPLFYFPSLSELIK